MHCRVFSGIPGPHPVKSVVLPSFDHQKCLQMLPNVPWRGEGAKFPSIPVEKHYAIIV